MASIRPVRGILFTRLEALMTSKLALGIVVCLALTAQAANPARSYVVTNLGDFAGGFDRSSAFDINSMGQVAGYSSAADGGRAFLWTPSTPNGTTGSLTNLGFLPSGASGSVASGINDRGQVVGNSGLFPFQHAFLWSPTTPNGITGSMTEIGFLPGLANASDATAINAYGQVAGESYSDTNRRAFLWTPDLPNGSVGS